MNERHFKFKFDNEDQKFTIDDVKQGIYDLVVRLIIHELNTATLIHEFLNGNINELINDEKFHKLIHGQCKTLIGVVFPTGTIHGLRMTPEPGGYAIDFEVDMNQIH